MKNVVSITREFLDALVGGGSRWDSLEDALDDRYPQHLRSKNLDWAVPLPKGGLVSFAELFNDQSPNGKIRDVIQPGLDLDEWSPEEEHLVLRDRIRTALRGELGKQVYSIQYYQVPAPTLTKANTPRKRAYLEEVFKAQDVILDDHWIREPQILLESGGSETIVADPADAEWVADLYPELKANYAEIGFLVDFTESVDPEGILQKLPDESVKKVRVDSLTTTPPGNAGDSLSKSLVI